MQIRVLASKNGFSFPFFYKKDTILDCEHKEEVMAQVDSLEQKSKSGLYNLRASCYNCSRRDLFLKLHLYIENAYLGISCFSVNTPKRKDQKKCCFTLYIVSLIAILLRSITF